MDDGSPLYTVENCQGDLPARCLYGVASYYKNESSEVSNQETPVRCEGGSFFASVVHYKDWIHEKISLNMRLLTAEREMMKPEPWKDSKLDILMR